MLQMNTMETFTGLNTLETFNTKSRDGFHYMRMCVYTNILEILLI